MGVTLQVISANAHKLGGQSEIAFPSSGTIGRSQDNTLVLPDPEKYISGKHAQIEERGDGCYITDLSVNGTYVNGAEQPIGHGNSQRLEDGDRFRIGEYEFEAVLQAEQALSSQSSQWPPPSSQDPFGGSGGGSDPFGSPDPFGAQNPMPGGGFDPLKEQEKDPLNLISGQPDPFAPAASPAARPSAGTENASYNIGDVGNFTPPRANPDPLAPSSSPFPPPADDPFGPPPGGPSVDPLAPGSGLGGGADSGGIPAIPDDWDKTTLPGMSEPSAAPSPAPGGDPWPQSPGAGFPESHPAGFPPGGAPAPGAGQAADPFGQPAEQPPYPPTGPQGAPGVPPEAGQPMPGGGFPGQPPGQMPPDQGGIMPPPGQGPMPPPGMPPGQAGMQAPPPGMQTPPPGMQTPPPGMQTPPPGMQPTAPGMPPAQPGMQPPQPGMPGAQPPAAAGGSAGLTALLEAAGFDQATAAALDNPATAHAIGQTLRIVVHQMMEVLRARANLKNEFRVPMTQIAPTTNNPLKFCANDVDALTRLLIQDRRGFMGMVEAVNEGFEDIKNHQLSMMAGMQAAYGNLLSSFNPSRLQENFDPKLGRGDMLRKHGKYWDMFEDLYRDLAKDGDNTFARLFGDEFARAYEEQMDILSRNRRR